MPRQFANCFGPSEQESRALPYTLYQGAVIVLPSEADALVLAG